MEPAVLREKLLALGISPSTEQMLVYWLSLCDGDRLPRREAFQPAAISELLRGAALFDVRPGESVHCRIAGMILKLAFGPGVAGQDWLAITPTRHRSQRLARYSAVAEGAVAVGRRQAIRPTNEPVRIEEIMLPFADVAEDGARQVLVHSDWRPEGAEWLGVDASAALTLADEFHLIPLR